MYFGAFDSIKIGFHALLGFGTRVRRVELSLWGTLLTSQPQTHVK